MATSLHSIANLEAEKIVVIGGHELHVLYHPFKITPATEKKHSIALAEGIEQYMEFVIKTIIHVVASWDLSLDEQGTEIVPLEHEQLEHLPMLLLQEIYNSVVTGLGY